MTPQWLAHSPVPFSINEMELTHLEDEGGRLDFTCMLCLLSLPLIKFSMTETFQWDNYAKRKIMKRVNTASQNRTHLLWLLLSFLPFYFILGFLWGLEFLKNESTTDSPDFMMTSAFVFQDTSSEPSSKPLTAKQG